jgi:Fe-S cluster assembly iron-binding protein IscA
VVTLTESAANKVKSLLSDKDPDVALRIFIKSGG